MTLVRLRPLGPFTTLTYVPRPTPNRGESGFPSGVWCEQGEKTRVVPAFTPRLKPRLDPGGRETSETGSYVSCPRSQEGRDRRLSLRYRHCLESGEGVSEVWEGVGGRRSGSRSPSSKKCTDTGLRLGSFTRSPSSRITSFLLFCGRRLDGVITVRHPFLPQWLRSANSGRTVDPDRKLLLRCGGRRTG